MKVLWRTLALLVSLGPIFSCQASYNIRPDRLPKRLSGDDLILKNYDGEMVNLAKGKFQAVVLFFFQTKCPCVKRYQQRINDLFERYSPRGIGFYYVSSNSNESFDEAYAAYEKRALSLPLLRDEGGKLAAAVSAQGTPSAAIIDQHGDLVLLGWIDNERKEQETGRIAHLENAIKDVLAHRPIAVKTSPMFGCPIR